MHYIKTGRKQALSFFLSSIGTIVTLELAKNLNDGLSSRSILGKNTYRSWNGGGFLFKLTMFMPLLEYLYSSLKTNITYHSKDGDRAENKTKSLTSRKLHSSLRTQIFLKR